MRVRINNTGELYLVFSFVLARSASVCFSRRRNIVKWWEYNRKFTWKRRRQVLRTIFVYVMSQRDTVIHLVAGGWVPDFLMRVCFFFICLFVFWIYDHNLSGFIYIYERGCIYFRSLALYHYKERIATLGYCKYRLDCFD